MPAAKPDAAMAPLTDPPAMDVESQDDVDHSTQDTAPSTVKQGPPTPVVNIRLLADDVKEEAHADIETTAKEAALTTKAIAAERLPVEILQKILYRIDSETFASATLVSRNWRNAANDAKLYAHHLSHSPLYSRQNSVITGPLDDTRLAELKRAFVEEAKRCLFTPFLRPKVTIVNLISETPLSSFAAGPGGEKFDFTFSQYGRWCLAISSSRIYVVDLRGKDSQKVKETIEATTSEESNTNDGPASGPKSVTKGKGKGNGTAQDVETNVLRVAKELKVVRRPLAADILADGSVLAVLSSDHKVSLYNVKEDKVELRRTVDLDNPPYTISMSSGGEILAAAFDGGMELCSLRQNASPSERRTVKCHRVDRLMFSSDGSMLLGTTSTKDPATVILTAPYFNAMEHDLTQAEMVNSMWTQQILFPSSSRDCSHSTLLPRYGDDNSNWTLTYDRTYESFRAVRTDDLRNGTTYFPGPQTGADRRVQWPKDALVPSSLPSTTARGDLVAAGFKGSEIWLYGVPDNLDATVNAQAPTPMTENRPGVTSETPPGNASTNTSGETSEGERPRWQMLVDKYRNVFSKGKKVLDVTGISAMCWYKQIDAEDTPTMHRTNERLIVAAPGGVGSDFILDEETPIEGGRLVVLDFSLEPHDGTTQEITIELGKTEPLLLEEQKTDMEAEIAKVRRRTMATRDAARVRSVIDALRPNNDLEDIPDVPEVPGSLVFGETGRDPGEHPDVSDEDEPGVSVEEAAAFAEGPYSHTNPRSRTALYRSATISAASRQRLPQLRHFEQTPQPQMRRTDGTEVPDESDADNWRPPPPPYQRYVDEQLPDDLVQRALLYNNIAPIPHAFDDMMRPRRSSSVNTDNRSTRRRSSVDTDLLAHHLRPSRPGDDVFRAGDTTAVSSATPTPRSSIRRRPLTTYTTSSSVALRDSHTGARDSNVGLRDSNIARPISHLTRSSSLSSSANMRLSRSESLRRTSQGGSLLAQSPPPPTLHEQSNWPLPAPQEQPEPISPPEEAADPLAQETVEALPSPPEVPVDRAEEASEVVSIPSPSSDPSPVSPEEKVVHIPPEGEDEEISPRANAPPDLPVAPWVDTPPQRDSPPAQQLTALPPVSPPETETVLPREASTAMSPHTQAGSVERAATAPVVSAPALEPTPVNTHVRDDLLRPLPQQAVQAEVLEMQANQSTVQEAQSSSCTSVPTQRQPQGTDFAHVSEALPAQQQIARGQQQQFELQALSMPPEAAEVPSQPSTQHATSHEHGIPEPSAFQVANLGTRRRPHARQLSGSVARDQVTSPGPNSHANQYSTNPYSTAYAGSNTTPTAELDSGLATLATDASSIKSRKRSKRLSQRIRGAFRRADPNEPMPELPIIPGVQQPQPQPEHTTPTAARHSRLYADNRINASEPALRRPQAQRLDTIESVGSGLGRNASIRRGALTPEPGTPMHMPAVPETIPEGRRPRPKRSRSIFGSRRRSQAGAVVVQNDEMPPVPAIPGAIGEWSAGRAGSMPHPGSIERAATAEPMGYFPTNQRFQTEITGGSGGKKKKGKDKDGKCSVM